MHFNWLVFQGLTGLHSETHEPQVRVEVEAQQGNLFVGRTVGQRGKGREGGAGTLERIHTLSRQGCQRISVTLHYSFTICHSSSPTLRTHTHTDTHTH